MPTILHRLAKWAVDSPDAPAQRYKSDGQWVTVTAKELRDRIFHLALFLESRGFTAQDVCAIFSYNCPQWVQLDLAAVLLGGKSAGMYPNSSKKDIDYILQHTGAKVLGVQNREYFEKTSSPHVELVLAFDGDSSLSPSAVAFNAALQEGRRLASTRRIETYLERLDPQAGAFLIYTSGTTGLPKGALLTQDNLAFTADLVADYWGLKGGGETLFSFLPLCHIAEKLQNVGVGITCRYTVNYCTKFDNVSQELTEAQPTLLLSVPRLWEKMMAGVLAKIENSPEPRKTLALWALGVGARCAAKRYAEVSLSKRDQIELKIANALVLNRIRHALGLERIKQAASGASALPAHVAKWFRALNIEIMEDFGQTESTGVICMTPPGSDCLGSVGQPVPGIEFQIADDGEILTKGRHVFKEYYKDPKSTSETIVDGWLHTGDLGEVLANGVVRIRGRKKEIMKTSGGKMIAPVPIEEKLKKLSLIAQACIVGDGRKYFSALLTLSASVDCEGPLVTNAEVLEQIEKHIHAVNRELASYEQIKYFKVLARDFSIEENELTPTLKMKRNVIEARYRDIIDQMYAG